MRLSTAYFLTNFRCAALITALFTLSGQLSSALAQPHQVLARADATALAAKAAYKAPDQFRVRVKWEVASKPVRHVSKLDRSAKPTPAPVEVDWNDAAAMLSKGQDATTAQQYAAAKRYYTRAADLGNAEAMNALGILYENDLDGAHDYTQARIWYQKAADKGSSSGMFNLGRMYVNGEGMAQERAQARIWYQKAANLGHPTAMYYLGRMYANGLGGAQDYAQARIWYQKAADAGDNHAKQSLQNLVGK